ncbi:NfeD family protein [Desulfitibacter alkalitolerans]|uniref:NfeD family protein n=1 Tax=Desulfitibacter alkalitolerans TaxID=264641 RepID=UPI000683DB58|nr:nodulation protein NfeD [Desulfitibacter alkalitolerans]
MIRKICKLTMLCVLCLLLTFTASAGAAVQPKVITVAVDDMVTAGTASTIKRAIQLAEKQGAQAVVIQLNTPGGLVTATLDIIQDISAAQIPVITYVTPPGAIAASAGTFILICGHVAAMSPATTCGAAMPVTMAPVTGEGTQSADDKTINFLAGHMRSIAEERGRPVDIAEKFVKENLTIDYKEALEKQVIDHVAVNLGELLEMIHGKEITIQERVVVLNTLGADIQTVEMKTSERITHFVSNPQVTFILLLLGVYGLIIGFNSPGTFLPEVMGVISLILALYGLGLFEVNILAGLLIIIGILLLVAEAFTPTYGVLGVGGVISIVLGSIFLPIEPMMPTDWFSRFRMTAIGIGIVSGALLIILLSGIIKLRKVQKIHGDEEFSNQVVPVIEDINPEGLVKVKGEIWKAVSKGGISISQGENVRVIGRKGMYLVVEPERTNISEREE